jgi:hypothetical protein
MPLLELSTVCSLIYSEDFRAGRTLFSKRALMVEEIDVLIRQKTIEKVAQIRLEILAFQEERCYKPLALTHF